VWCITFSSPFFSCSPPITSKLKKGGWSFPFFFSFEIARSLLHLLSFSPFFFVFFLTTAACLRRMVRGSLPLPFPLFSFPLPVLIEVPIEGLIFSFFLPFSPPLLMGALPLPKMSKSLFFFPPRGPDFSFSSSFLSIIALSSFPPADVIDLLPFLFLQRKSVRILFSSYPLHLLSYLNTGGMEIDSPASSFFFFFFLRGQMDGDYPLFSSRPFHSALLIPVDGVNSPFPFLPSLFPKSGVTALLFSALL